MYVWGGTPFVSGGCDLHLVGAIRVWWVLFVSDAHLLMPCAPLHASHAAWHGGWYPSPTLGATVPLLMPWAHIPTRMLCLCDVWGEEGPCPTSLLSLYSALPPLALGKWSGERGTPCTNGRMYQCGVAQPRYRHQGCALFLLAWAPLTAPWPRSQAHSICLPPCRCSRCCEAHPLGGHPVCCCCKGLLHTTLGYGLFMALPLGFRVYNSTITRLGVFMAVLKAWGRVCMG